MRTPAPAVIVIFGATGDLTQRKLLPGLYSLAVQQLLPPETAIIGVARSDLSDDEFRARMRAGVEAHSRFPVDEGVWEGFARRLHYLSAPFDEDEGYGRLRDADRRARTATAARAATASSTSRPRPSSSRSIAENLGRAGLADEGDGTERFARIVVEKPFGDGPRVGARAERTPATSSSASGRSTGSTTTWGRRRSRTCWCSASPTPSSSRSGTAATSTTCRSRWPRTSASGRRGGYYDQSGRAARHRAEPHAAAALARRDGAAGPLREPRRARREGEGAARDPAASTTADVRARRGARPVRRRLDRRASGCPATARSRASTRSSNTETFVAMRAR